ncbi:MAG: DUF4097 family beta strand repeat-containing protein [Thermoanaerobaculia bacterium]
MNTNRHSSPLRLSVFGALVALLALASTSPLAASRRGWLKESSTVTRSFRIAPGEGQRRLVIDNVLGSVEVRTGGSSDTVELTLTQTYEAADAGEMARAKSDVELEVREEAGKLVLLQGGPWRCSGNDRRRHRDAEDDDWGDGCCCGDHGDRDYEVTFDWTLTVPKTLDLWVRNVNDGEIRIDGVHGRLRVRHVNDDVRLTNVGGTLDAQTVNGELKVEFDSLPTGGLEFATVNGDVDLTFPAGFGAELSFHTLNGEVYTDFPFTLANRPPPPVSAKDDRKGHHRRSTSRQTVATLGTGGVAVDCSTVNGDITIRERG